MIPEMISAVWFSGTGTTERTVKTIGKCLTKELNLSLRECDFTLPVKRRETLLFGASDLVVFGVPTYAGRVPNVLLPYLNENIKGNGALVIPVVLFGNRNFDDSLIELSNILTEHGFIVIAAGAFAGEHAFSTSLGAKRPDHKDEEEMEHFASQIAAKVRNLKETPKKSVAVDGCNPLRPYYQPKDKDGNPINILKVKPKTQMNLCRKCGWCAENCPMGSIDRINPSLLHGPCIKCGKCIKGCPTQAKYFDDEGFLYHKRDLESKYTARADNCLFL